MYTEPWEAPKGITLVNLSLVGAEGEPRTAAVYFRIRLSTVYNNISIIITVKDIPPPDMISDKDARRKVKLAAWQEVAKHFQTKVDFAQAESQKLVREE